MKAIYRESGHLPEIIDIEDSFQAIREKMGGRFDANICDGDKWVIIEKPRDLRMPEMNSADPILVVGIKKDHSLCDVDADEALRVCFSAVQYKLIDREHNVWRCPHCGHIERFEADGPYENGWKVCPSCCMMVLPTEEEAEDDG